MKSTLGVFLKSQDVVDACEKAVGRYNMQIERSEAGLCHRSIQTILRVWDFTFIEQKDYAI